MEKCHTFKRAQASVTFVTLLKITQQEKSKIWIIKKYYIEIFKELKIVFSLCWRSLPFFPFALGHTPSHSQPQKSSLTDCSRSVNKHVNRDVLMMKVSPSERRCFFIWQTRFCCSLCTITEGNIILCTLVKQVNRQMCEECCYTIWRNNKRSKKMDQTRIGNTIL